MEREPLSGAQVRTGADAVTALRRWKHELDRCPAFCQQSDWLVSCATRLPATPLLVTVVDPSQRLRSHASLGVRHGRGRWIVESLGGHLADYAPVHADTPDDARAIARGLHEWLSAKGAWTLRIDQLDLEDPLTSALLHELPASELSVGPPMPQLRLGSETKLSKARRKAVRQARNRLDRDHPGWSINCRTGDGAGEVIEQLIRVRVGRDHSIGRRSDLDSEAARHWYTEVLTGLLHRRRAYVFTLDTPTGGVTAYAVAVDDGPVIRLWDGRVASGWERYSGGKLCVLEAVGKALDNPAAKRFDWLRGLDGDKAHDDMDGRWALRAASSRRVEVAERVTSRSVGLAKAAVPIAARRRVLTWR